MPEAATELEAEYLPGKHRNGRRARTRLLRIEDLDMRMAPCRAVLQCEQQIIEDLGGQDMTSEVQRQLVRRSAVLSAVLSDAETKWANGAEFDLTKYCVAASTLKRLAETIGLERKMRPADRLAVLMGDD